MINIHSLEMLLDRLGDSSAISAVQQYHCLQIFKVFTSQTNNDIINNINFFQYNLFIVYDRT